MIQTAYIGRFAPSPTGALHAGSLASALASWLDARAHGGTWLLRIEDVDTPRCVSGADQHIVQQLAACGMTSDAPVVYQSTRFAQYEQALNRLATQGMAYPCTCSRKEIEHILHLRGTPTLRGHEPMYPATCRPANRTAQTLAFRPQVAWRFRSHGQVFTDTGDFVLWRKDGFWAYQLAVVVDDALQGITHVVRGADLLDNTARQIQLQQALNYPNPHYLHTPLVLGTDGEKLSKQNGATAIDVQTPTKALAALNSVAPVLRLPISPAHATIAESLSTWIAVWASLKNKEITHVA